jgi:hypothetical protein
LLGLGLLLVLLPLVLVSQAVALDTTNPPSFTFVNDENGADDQPGQKDLSAQAVATPSLNDLWVAWKWDVTSLSGGNTGDACALFDTNTNFKVNFAVCVTIQGNPAVQAPTSPRVYTCGDGKVDRCTSTYTQITPISTACSVNQAGVNNTDPFHNGQTDTTAVCHIALSDVGGAGTASLVNTCSYPSQQPTSDPSDCVLIPRDAFIRIAKVATPNSGTFPFQLDGATTGIVFPTTSNNVATGSETSSYIPIRSDNTHSVKELVPSGWDLTSASCSGASGTGSSNGTFSVDTISGIDASPDNQITCTFNDRKRASIDISKTGSDSGAQTGAVFTLYTGFGTAQQATVGTCTVDANGDCGPNDPSFSNLIPGTQYTIDETTVPSGYNKPASLPQNVTLTAGQAFTVSYTDQAQPGSASITKLDDAGNGVPGATFTVYQPASGTTSPPTGSAVGSCQTGNAGTCTISNLTPGTYTIDESVVPSGYAKDSAFPKNITITNGQATTVSATDPRQFKAIVIVCRQSTNTLYSSTVTINGASVPDSLGTAPSGITESTLCGLTAGAKSGLLRSGNAHSASITIP